MLVANAVVIALFCIIVMIESWMRETFSLSVCYCVHTPFGKDCLCLVFIGLACLQVKWVTALYAHAASICFPMLLL